MFPNSTFVAPTIGSGNRLVVGEAPGEEEDIQGKPLVGGSGNTFNLLLAKAGIKRDPLTIVNTINCRPPNNLYPTDADAKSYISPADAEKVVQHCYTAHVEPLLKSRKWSRIDLLGEKALNRIAGVEGIGKWRGSPLVVGVVDPDHPVAIATWHPSYLMRDQAMFPVAVNDLRKSLIPPPEFYNLYPSIDDVRRFTATEFAVDIETTREWEPRVKLVGLCAKPYEALVVPFTPSYIPELKRIFTNATKLITQNGIQFDIPILFQALGIRWEPRV
jgi:uracil-DNA glycosylase family 4